MTTHETIEYDVVIVGAGPAGLSAAIKLKQLAQSQNITLNVCILEKGASVGAHILSGAVLDPKSLMTLLPNTWENAPLSTPAISDAFYYLTRACALHLPTPKQMKNTGNYIISLEELCQFLGREAEALGCEIYPSFAASRILYGENGEVLGVATGDQGIDKGNVPTERFQPGMHIRSRLTLFAEGCRGQLSQELMDKFRLREGVQPQTYGIGIKELWRIRPEQHQKGHVIHTVGWPLDNRTYGGSFLYHLSENRLAIGMVVGLDYTNPWLDPFAEFQRFKTHPFIKPTLTGGERIGYGARALNEGGFQSLPKLTFPGGALIGDAAGFLNVPKIKGIHLAMQSGILAAESAFQHFLNPSSQKIELFDYPQKIKQSWVIKELYQARNIRPGFQRGLFFGLANAAFETYISRGNSPWTLKNHADNLTLQQAGVAKPIDYPKPDGVFTFDKLSSVYLTNTFHEENQPCHLKLRDLTIPIEVNYKQYASPETRYCPAAVYEIVEVNQQPRLLINAQNCIHCKTCDIKDPRQNIVWRAPEGGGGPNYTDM
jgi:electron-transferring-flavoprotein dehydrogenase